MKEIIVVLLFTVFSLKVSGQELAKSIRSSFNNKNSLQFELFGHGLVYSLGYERILFNGDRFKTTGQVGFSYFPKSTDIRTIWIPIAINGLVSFTQHHIEFGLGHVFAHDSEWEPFASFRVGYRYQKPDGRLLFRVGFTPFIEYKSALEFGVSRNVFVYPSGGAAIGYNF